MAFNNDDGVSLLKMQGIGTPVIDAGLWMGRQKGRRWLQQDWISLKIAQAVKFNELSSIQF